jgi:hypothetical protein
MKMQGIACDNITKFEQADIKEITFFKVKDEWRADIIVSAGESFSMDIERIVSIKD